MQQPAAAGRVLIVAAARHAARLRVWLHMCVFFSRCQPGLQNRTFTRSVTTCVACRRVAAAYVCSSSVIFGSFGENPVHARWDARTVVPGLARPCHDRARATRVLTNLHRDCTSFSKPEIRMHLHAQAMSRSQRMCLRSGPCAASAPCRY